MPTNLFCNRSSSSKSIKLTILSLLLPLVFYAQSLTGLWVGSLGNDSTTVRKDQSFEIALTEYNGKVYGYSRSEFIVDDVLYYIVKRVKGTIEGDVCEVTDDEIVAFNFPKKLDKNIKVTSTFRKDKGDSVWHMDGKWKTNATKKYYSVTGKVELEAEKDLTASKIFPHLEELKMADDVAFYKERKEGQPIVRIAKPEKVIPEFTSKPDKLSAEKETVSPDAIVKTVVKEPATNPVKPSVATANGKTVVAENAVALNTKNNAQPGITKAEQANQSVNTETKNTSGDKKVEDIELIKDIPPANMKEQAVLTNATAQKTVTTSTQEIAPAKKNADVTTSQLNKATEIKTAVVVKSNPVVEKKELEKQESITAKQTESFNTSPDNKTTVNTVASNSKPGSTNTGTTVKNNTVVEKKEPVKQNAAVVKNKQTNNTKSTETIATKPEATITGAIVKNNPVVEKKEPVSQDITVVKNQTATNTKQTEAVATNKDNKTLTNTSAAVTKPTTTNTEAVVKNNPVTEQKAIIPIAPEKRPDADITFKAAMIAGRKSEFSQVVNFKSDSLQISLYDNGEIDGDTVSVFMNGEVLLSKQGLKSSAIKKTIYVAAGQEDEFTLVMFAESLGKYPPNTGLLVIRDGDDVYNLRFSSDFQKNAGIVFKRKR